VSVGSEGGGGLHEERDNGLVMSLHHTKHPQTSQEICKNLSFKTWKIA